MMNANRSLIWSAVLPLLMLSCIAVAGGAGAAEPATEPADKPASTAAKKPAQAVVAGSQAELGMSVTGTQEAPKVLYIVPWKTLDAVPAEPYVSGLLDEVFSPVDPVVFERSVRHHEQIQGAAPAAEPQP